VQYYAQRARLRLTEHAQLINDSTHHRICHTARLALPAFVTEVVDVAVAAVQVAPTGRLDQYGINLPIQDRPLTVVAVVGPVVATSHHWFARPDLFDQPL
jgi:hypothetical protein